MVDQDNNFLSNFTAKYTQDLITAKQTLKDATKAWEKADKDLFDMQTTYSRIYIKAIVKKFMLLWNESDKFPKDDELTNVIFFMGGMPLDKDQLSPDTQIHLDGTRNEFVFKYMNNRLNQWIVLKP